MDKKRVAVIFGGKSPEHEVSIITGLQALENIDNDKFDAFPIYVSKTGQFFAGEALSKIETYKHLSKISSKSQEVRPIFGGEVKGFSFFKFGLSKVLPVDVLFVCFHGGLGENGGFAGLFELMDLPYTGPGITAGANGMDKVEMKDIFKQNNLPVGNYVWFYRNAWEKESDEILEKISKLSYPLFVKPASCGSSIGVTKVKNKEELKNAIEVACVFDRKIIVEEAAQGQEINISVLGNSGEKLRTSICEEVFHTKDLLSYNDKYLSENGKNPKSSGMASATRKIPAKIKKETQEKIEEYAKIAFRAIDGFGVTRVDFIADEKSGKIIILEANTIPGSLSFYLWEPAGLTFKELTTSLINLAIQRYEEDAKNTKSFPSNILENANFSGKGKI
jgi:D-alanine-D-alanine ligase